jgi:hypothetical protein
MRLFIILMLLWMATPANSSSHLPDPLKEIKIPILCGPTPNMLQGLRDRFSEEIIFMAPSQNVAGDNLTHSLWINMDSTTWSFVVVNKERNTTCIISSGDGAYTALKGTRI